LAQAGEGAELADHRDGAVIDIDFLQSGVDQLKLDFIQIAVLWQRELDHRLAREHEIQLAGVDHLAAVFVENDLQVADGAVRIVGRALDDEQGAVRAFALVGDFGNIGGVLAGGALDGVLDVFLREVLGLGVVDRHAQGCVGLRVRAAAFGGHRDGFGQLRKDFGHRGPSRFLRPAAAFKMSSHGFGSVENWPVRHRGGDLSRRAARCK